MHHWTGRANNLATHFFTLMAIMVGLNYLSVHFKDNRVNALIDLREIKYL